MSDKIILGSYLGACAIITWRDFTHPDSNWPLPAPPPYRYLWATVGFGLCYALALFTDDRIGEVLAGGLLLGLAFQTAATYKKSAGGPSGSPGQPTGPRNLSPTSGVTPV